MKKSKIPGIHIHRAGIPKEKQKEICEKLSNYHTKAIKQIVDNTNSSAKDKLKIISDK